MPLSLNRKAASSTEAMVTESLIISTNYWRVPSPEHALEGWLEGNPSQAERQKAIAAAAAARAAWKPSDEAFNLVEQLRGFSGCKVKLQFWDSIMFLLEPEGPFPALADCRGVTLLQDDGFLQAYLIVEGVTEIPTVDGYSPEGYFIKRVDCEYLLAPVADLYSIARVGIKPE